MTGRLVSARIGAVTDVDASAADRQSGRNRGEQFLRSHLPMVIVAVVIVLAVIFVASDRWRRGALFFGGATLLAAAFRLCLPTARVGLLAVRSKPFDVATLSILGTLIVFIAATINTLGVG